MAGRKKIYYPKGQILGGRFTAGKEWMLEDGTEFKGAYHTYTTNEVFTESSYVRGRSKKLIPYVNMSEEANKKKFEYDGLVAQTPKKFTFANYSKQIPTQLDYDRGYFYRYFVKRRTSDYISEVNLENYGKADTEHFIKVKLAWKIAGPLNDTSNERGVIDTNRRILIETENTMSKISEYVKNLTEWLKS